MGVAKLVEAAVRGGDDKFARDALERLAETTRPCGTNVVLGIEARCRALLSDGVAADDLYREAIERVSRTRLRPEFACICSMGSGCAARADASTRASNSLPPTARSSRSEWRRSPSAPAASWSRRREGAQAQPETLDGLMAQEEQIARLAGNGLSNRRSACSSSFAPAWSNAICARGGRELPKTCQRIRLVTPGAAPLDLASPPRLRCDVVVQRIGD
jgi:hypothetical protein